MDGDHEKIGLITLTPVQSKKLIAEAVAVHPVIQKALQTATIVIGRGTTNAYVAARLTGQIIDELKFCAGIIRDGELAVIPKGERIPGVILRKGKLIVDDPIKIIADFGRDDVLIKGGNALDPDGIVGVLLRSREGGTIGRSLGIITARGSNLIVPLGLEKLIPSVLDAVEGMGIDRIDYATGEKTGLMPVIGAEVITEIDAFRTLAGVEATMVSAGGWGDSQGSVVLSLRGIADQVEKAIQWTKFVKEETNQRPEN
jgi:hypothetical protein